MTGERSSRGASGRSVIWSSEALPLRGPPARAHLLSPAIPSLVSECLHAGAFSESWARGRGVRASCDGERGRERERKARGRGPPSAARSSVPGLHGVRHQPVIGASRQWRITENLDSFGRRNCTSFHGSRVECHLASSIHS